MNPNQIRSMVDSISYHKVMYTQMARKLNFLYKDECVEIHVNYTTFKECSILGSLNEEKILSINWIFVIKNGEDTKTICSETQGDLIKNKDIFNCSSPVCGNLYLSDIREVILESLKMEGKYAK